MTIIELLDLVWQLATLFAGNCAYWLGAARGAGDPVDIFKPSFQEG